MGVYSVVRVVLAISFFEYECSEIAKRIYVRCLCVNDIVWLCLPISFLE